MPGLENDLLNTDEFDHVADFYRDTEEESDDYNDEGFERDEDVADFNRPISEL